MDFEGIFHCTSLAAAAVSAELDTCGMQAVALVNASFFTGTPNQVDVIDKPITLNATFAECSPQIQFAVRAFLAAKHLRLLYGRIYHLNQFWMSSNVLHCNMHTARCLIQHIVYFSVSQNYIAFCHTSPHFQNQS